MCGRHFILSYKSFFLHKKMCFIFFHNIIFFNSKTLFTIHIEKNPPFSLRNPHPCPKKNQKI